MALKATIYKARLSIADIDRGVYADHQLTIARHPSETDERMMMRLLAFALEVPADDRAGMLEFAKGLSDTDEPELWRKNLSGEIEQWIEVGQPDERRLLKACGRAAEVSVYGYGASTPMWWSRIESKLSRADRLAVWQIDAERSRSLAELAQRGMQLQVTVQDGTATLASNGRSVEVTPRRLFPR